MIELSVDVRNARLVAVANAVDAAPIPGTLRIYEGERPKPGASLAGQTLLVEALLPQPCIKSVAGGVLTFADIAPAESAAGLIRTIDGSGMAETNSFRDYKGEKIAW